ncbi:MAG: glycosyltransferase family 4 protein, partial [Usitatibacter sp.]
YRGRGAVTRRFIRWIYASAERVIALSEEWREALSAMEPASRVVVIPNPVEIPSWQSALDAGPPTVLFLGMIKERKGVHDLLRAWPGVRREVPGARLVLGGVGDVDEARALARALGVEASIEMPGWIVGDAKDALMKRAWVFALPSHYEALPMSVLEAQAAGVPVVSTRVGGIPAAVDHGRTGILLEPRDVPGLEAALTHLLSDEGQRKAVGRAARGAAAERFSADVLVPKVDAIWREIVPGAERPGAVPAALVRTD